MNTTPRFTPNKQVVRNLQFETIKKYLAKKLGRLKYFGLPSDEMKDITDWKNAFSLFYAVERGIEPATWKTQHNLMLNAFKVGILSKLTLLRGDIDKIIWNGIDSYGNKVDYPFDVITLDYSGGLFYRTKGKHDRLDAIRKLIEQQSIFSQEYLLFISCNLDSCKDAEVTRALKHIQTELVRYGKQGKDIIESYLNHEREEVRLKIYVPFFINQIATATHYNCTTEKVIFYSGNKNTKMMNFRFYLKHDALTTVPRPSKEKLLRIINIPMIEIKDGRYKDTYLGLTKVL